jgi:hypothetical protein
MKRPKEIWFNTLKNLRKIEKLSLDLEKLPL